MSVPANSMPSAPVIEVRGVHTRFGSAVVHRGIDLDVGAGDILGMVGGSGSQAASASMASTAVAARTGFIDGRLHWT